LPWSVAGATLRRMSTASSRHGPDEEFLRRMSAPDNEVPVTLPVDVVLARTDDVAVALLGLQVYPPGSSSASPPGCAPTRPSATPWPS
jgi:hypothetical protein